MSIRDKIDGIGDTLGTSKYSKVKNAFDEHVGEGHGLTRAVYNKLDKAILALTTKFYTDEKFNKNETYVTSKGEIITDTGEQLKSILKIHKDIANTKARLEHDFRTYASPLKVPATLPFPPRQS